MPGMTETPTSIRLPADIEARRAAVKNATGYREIDLYLYGLVPVEAEAAAAVAVARAGGNPDCAHAALYPNGRCRACYAVPQPPDLTLPA